MSIKIFNHLAGCGVVILSVVWSGTAAEPQKATTSDRQVAPVMFAPPGGTNAAGRSSPFSAEIGADFIKKVMETSAKIEEAKRQIAERQMQLYATNPEIKAMRARMIAAQKEINQILDADQELVDLKISRDILWSTMPVLPKGQNPGAKPRMPVTR